MIRRLFQTIQHHHAKHAVQVQCLSVFQREYHLSTTVQSSKQDKIDYSCVPVLDDHDLEEQMVRGSGPGGQAVNKTNNCIVLKHKPTGIVVKCHMHRSASSNRKEARRLMIARLDEKINGEFSVENQIKQLEMKKSFTNTWKRKKTDEMKKKWKERENID